MREYFVMLGATPLFRGFTQAQLRRLLAGEKGAPALLAPQLRDAAAGETLLMAGYETRRIGVVLEGRLEAHKESAEGRESGRLLMARLGPGRIFGDILAGGGRPSPVTVNAVVQSRIMYIEWPLLLKAGGTPEEAELHRRMLANLVAEISDKYFALDRRLDLLLLHGLRRRLAAYLLEEAAAAKSRHFTIPLNRAGLAAWLGCERSALSREISAMAKAGLIDTRRSRFYLPHPEKLRALL